MAALQIPAGIDVRSNQASLFSRPQHRARDVGVLDALDGADEDRRKSRLDLIAFRGEVNAGDAGIRVVGDINIAALRVVNAANIEVSGDAVGISQGPSVNVGALAAASSASSAIVSEAARLTERSRPQVRTDMPVIFSVRLLGFTEQRIERLLQVCLMRSPTLMQLAFHLRWRALPCRICPTAHPSISAWIMHHQSPGPNS